MQTQRFSWLVWCLVFLVLCSISGSLAVSSGDQLRYYDERDYQSLAQRLLETGSYITSTNLPTAYRPPGYPALLAAVYSVWNQPLAAKLVNVLALLVAALCIARMAERALPGSGIVAAAIVAVYPPFVYTASTLYPQVIVLALLCVGAMLLTEPKRKSFHVAMAALVFGCLTLTAGTFLPFIPLIGLWLLWRERRRSARALVRAVLLVALATAVVAPWTARNWVTFHAFVPISTNGGVNLLLGNNPNAGPDTGLLADIKEYRKSSYALYERDEVARDEFMRAAAFDWIEQNPSEAARLYIGKWSNHWNFTNETKTHGATSWAVSAILFISFYPLLGLAAWRLLTVSRRPLSNTEGFLVVMVLVNAFISAIFFTRIRFRLPFDGLLIALAAPVAVKLHRSLQAWLARSTQTSFEDAGTT